MNKIIYLKSLSLINFKGEKNRTITFDPKETTIYGDNKVGKTTEADAFRWILFDKNSEDKSVFNIKPLNQDGSPVHFLDTEVEAIFNVNGKDITLKKSYKENWTKPRQQEEKVLSGHTTTYYYNESVITQREYMKYVDDICAETTFKLLTDPSCFPNLHWNKQRDIISSIIPTVTDDQVAGENPAFTNLIYVLKEKGISIEQYKKDLAIKRKNINDNEDTGLDFIPTRISEAQRNLPEAMDWAAIAGQIANIQTTINDIDLKISDASKGLEGENAKRTEIQRTINLHKDSKRNTDHELTSHMDNLRYEYDRKLRMSSNSLQDLKDTVVQNKTRITELEATIENLKKQRESKLSAWHLINNEKLTFTGDPVCPTCGQDLPEDFLLTKRAEAENTFNTNKASRLDTNVSEGKQTAASIKEAEGKILTAQSLIKDIETKLKEPKAESVTEPNYEAEKKVFLEGKKYNELTELISKLEKQLEDLGPAKVADTSELQTNRKTEQDKLDLLKNDLNKRDQITKGEARISELKSLQTKLGQQIADIEKIEFNIQQFENRKIDLIEMSVNSLFKVVKFKMFNRLINGSDEPTCVVMINGVPYPDLNGAGKIQAGLDIISVMSDHYEIYAPIWIDERESVFLIPEMKSQVINLIASEPDKTLRVVPGNPVFTFQPEPQLNLK